MAPTGGLLLHRYKKYLARAQTLPVVQEYLELLLRLGQPVRSMRINKRADVDRRLLKDAAAGFERVRKECEQSLTRELLRIRKLEAELVVATLNDLRVQLASAAQTNPSLLRLMARCEASAAHQAQQRISKLRIKIQGKCKHSSHQITSNLFLFIILYYFILFYFIFFV